ncbi:MAG TPA: hypothetical protein VIF62_29235, partial [Labilithrix sp.]
MRRGLLTTAAVLAATSAAVAGGNLIRSGQKGLLPRDSLKRHGAQPPPSAPWAPGFGAGGRVLGTLASARLGNAVPTLRAALGARATLVFDPASGHVVRANDLDAPPLVPGDPAASAIELLRVHHDAFGLPIAPDEGWIRTAVSGANGTLHYGIEQRAADGVPLYGHFVTVHVDALGAPLLIQSDADPAPQLASPATTISAEAAILRAGGRLSIGAARTATTARLVYYRSPDDGPEYRLTWQVDVGSTRVMVDAETEMVMGRVDRRQYTSGDANVWDPNPLDGGGLPDHADDPDNTTKVKGLDNPLSVEQAAGSGATVSRTPLDATGFLQGAICRINDSQGNTDGGLAGEAPASGAPADFSAYTSAGNAAQVQQTSVFWYVCGTEQRFEQLSASAGLDKTQLTQHLPMDVFLNITDTDQNGQTVTAVANAFFDPSTLSLQFGSGDGQNIVNIERDITVASHEFGHFIEHTYANDEAPQQNSPRRGMGEGFGDWTAMMHQGGLDARGGIADTACIGPSTIPNGGALRTCLRLNKGADTPADTDTEEHDQGHIICECFYSFAAIVNGKDAKTGDPSSTSLDKCFTVYLAGLPFLPHTNAQYSDLVDAMVKGAQQVGGSVGVTT